MRQSSAWCSSCSLRERWPLFVTFTRLTGSGDENALFLLQMLNTQINLRGLLLGGMIIGALGVLDDLVTTQASAVFELHHANPSLGFSRFVPFRHAHRAGPCGGNRQHAGSGVCRGVTPHVVVVHPWDRGIWVIWSILSLSLRRSCARWSGRWDWSARCRSQQPSPACSLSGLIRLGGGSRFSVRREAGKGGMGMSIRRNFSPSEP
jgi:hypothetical protein